MSPTRNGHDGLTILAIGFLAVTLAACQGRDRAPGPALTPAQPDNATAVAASTSPPSPPALGRAVTEPFGMALPAGVSVENFTPGVEHYRSRAQYESLLEFYETNLDGNFRLVRYERGAKFEATDGSGRTIYIYRERPGDGYILTYIENANESDRDSSQTLPGTATRPTDGGPADDGGASGAASRGDHASASAEAGDPRTALQGDGPTPASQSRRPVDPRPGVAERIDQGMGDPVSPEQNRNQEFSRTYPNRSPDPLGQRVTNGRAHPRIQDRVNDSRHREPINFVRGVRETRRNPNALF